MEMNVRNFKVRHLNEKQQGYYCNTPSSVIERYKLNEYEAVMLGYLLKAAGTKPCIEKGYVKRSMRTISDTTGLPSYKIYTTKNSLEEKGLLICVNKEEVLEAREKGMKRKYHYDIPQFIKEMSGIVSMYEPVKEELPFGGYEDDLPFKRDETVKEEENHKESVTSGFFSDDNLIKTLQENYDHAVSELKEKDKIIEELRRRLAVSGEIIRSFTTEFTEMEIEKLPPSIQKKQEMLRKS